MYLWNTHRLAEALGRQELTAAEKFRYILLFHAIYVVVGYVAWLFVRSSADWAYWIEGATVLVLTVIGLKRCRERYSIALQDRFIEDCILLQVPLAIKFFTFFWLTHVATSYFLVWLLPILEAETFEEMRRLNALIKTIYSTYPFLYMFLGTALFYLRLGHHMKTAAHAQRA